MPIVGSLGLILQNPIRMKHQSLRHFGGVDTILGPTSDSIGHTQINLIGWSLTLMDEPPIITRVEK